MEQKVKFAVMFTPIRMPVYTDKGNRNGYKTLYPDIGDFCKLRGIDVSECVPYDGALHSKGELKVLVPAMHEIEKMFPDEFNIQEVDDEPDWEDEEDA